MKRHLLSVLAVAAVASFAGAQQTSPDSAAKQPTAGASHKSTGTTASRARRTRRHTYTSGGEVDRGGPGYNLHAVARDFVPASDTRGDDLYRREQMMDSKCGKSREKCGTPR